MAEQQIDGPPNKKQKVGSTSTPTDNEDTFLDELPEELEDNSKPNELQQLLENDTPNSNLSSNKIHQNANPVGMTGNDLSNPSSPAINNNTNSVPSPSLNNNAMVSPAQITTSSTLASPQPSAPNLSAAANMNSQHHPTSGPLNPMAPSNSHAMTTEMVASGITTVAGAGGSVETVGQTTATTTDSPSRPQVNDTKPNITPTSQPNEVMNPSSSTSNSSHSALSTTVRIPFEKHFLPEELRRYLIPTLKKLYNMDPEGLPFRQPVDPRVIGCMDYFDIIKKPIDLSTIKRKLDTGMYKDPWECCDDVRLMFENAWLYNRKRSKVYGYCTKLAEIFEQEIDVVMRSLGFCCGHKSVETVGQTTATTTDSPSRPQVNDTKPNITPTSQPNEVMNPSSSTSNSSQSALSTTVRFPFEKHFLPEELRRYLIPTLEKLYNMCPEGLPFREPVDPKKLGCMDYFDIIKKPIDLSTIKRKLDTGMYKDPWECCDDVRLMFENAWLYNRKRSKVYGYCTKLAEIFEQEIDVVMRSLGFCCGHKYVFQPQVLCCFGKYLCTIQRGASYYKYQNRYHYCERCFNELPGDSVQLGDDPMNPSSDCIQKNNFDKLTNNHVDPEPFIECVDCGMKNHQICVLHHDSIWYSGFQCESCLRRRGLVKKENKYNSKRLPHTKLGEILENRVNEILKKNNSGAGEVTIRVVSSVDKVAEIKPGMKTRFDNSCQDGFPYRAKALFAFEEINGVDVCFFGMHVQEYGSNCLTPNTRRVYISYLDSVHFFHPRHFRTAVYHEILIGYLEYTRKLGYVWAHIWACPPCEGDDYIFHCHPPEQKIPSHKRLLDWCKKMLDKAAAERIVVEYKDILKQALDDNFENATELPYFDGDFWPNTLEDSIKEFDQEEEERKASAAAEAAGDMKPNGQGLNVCGLSQRLYNTMEKYKEVFFVIRMYEEADIPGLPNTVDPDPPMSCDLMDGCDAFLTLARDAHWEFSSLRRAKYSTMCMMFDLHNQGQDRFVYSCNLCKRFVETRYHCSECEDFDLCVPCFNEKGHEHKMDILGFDLDVNQ